MKQRHQVVVLTGSVDPTADLLERQLEAAGLDAARVVVDANHMPRLHVELEGSSAKGWIETSLGRTPLSQIAVILFRKPQVPEFRRENAGDSRFLSREAMGGLRAALEATGAVWINHPLSISAAESKMKNLLLAATLGLNVPQTAVSSDADGIHSWIQARDTNRLVGKAVTHGLIESTAGTDMVFTQALPSDFKATRDLEPGVPILLQQRLMKGADVRVNVVGSEVFGAKLQTPRDILDWRTLPDGGAWAECAVPANIRSGALQLCRDLGLAFGAIDFVIHGDKWYFLEVNPNGQWGWLEVECGQKISDAFCRLVRKHLDERI